MTDLDVPVLEQEPDRSGPQMEKWAIQSVMGETEEERQMAASCLIAAAKHWMRIAGIREDSFNQIYAQCSELIAKLEPVQALGQEKPATLVPGLHLVRSEP